MSNDHHQIRRVALTGGPAAGKTAVLDVLRRHLEGRVVVFGNFFQDSPTDNRTSRATYWFVSVCFLFPNP